MEIDDDLIRPDQIQVQTAHIQPVVIPAAWVGWVEGVGREEGERSAHRRQRLQRCPSCPILTLLYTDGGNGCSW